MKTAESYPDPRPLVLKRMIWDVFPHDYSAIGEAQGYLGLVPDEAEGMEVEHDASDLRIARMMPLHVPIGTLSDLAGSVVACYVIQHCQAEFGDDEDVLPPEVVAQFEAQTSEVIAHGAYAVISHLMDTGVLAYSDKFRRMIGCA